MNLITCDDWTGASIGDREYQFAQTSDPRILAVIQTDPYSEVGTLYDGDAINPVLYWERRFGSHWVAGFGDNGESGTINAALEQFSEETAKRYLWIFHGIVYLEASAPGDYDGTYMVVSSPGYHEHISNDVPATRAEAEEDCRTIRDDLQEALDGYVYGIGYATLPERLLHDDEPLNLYDWDIEMGCWGFVGEKYAKEEAAGFGYDTPSLPEMLEVRA